MPLLFAVRCGRTRPFRIGARDARSTAVAWSPKAAILARTPPRVRAGVPADWVDHRRASPGASRLVTSAIASAEGLK